MGKQIGQPTYLGRVYRYLLYGLVSMNFNSHAKAYANCARFDVAERDRHFGHLFMS